MADFDLELVERVAEAMFLAGGMAADWDNVTSEGAQEDRDYFRDLARAALGLLHEHYRLLPAGGVVTQQHGTLRDIGEDSAGVIGRVPRGWTGANYTRTVISWPEDVGPNDNWAIYYGPWTWNGVSP